MAVSGRDWSRRYPPLGGAAIAAAIALFVLPSALNIPLTNPTQTLEFAPIPPDEDDTPPPDTGNLQSLSLGESSTAPAADAPGGDGLGVPAPGTPSGVGDRPITKRCVGNPPRQTEDPLAPPCVAHFEGDNGGATFRGVDANEVRVLVYMNGGTNQVTSRGVEAESSNKIVDLDDPPTSDDYVYTRLVRGYSIFFNDRFQAYGRRVHFFIHYGNSAKTPETRRSDAADGIAQTDPFAVISFAGDNADDYLDAAAEIGVVALHGLLSGVSSNGFMADVFAANPGRIWSHIPSIDKRAELFSSYVCQKVVPYPVSFSGNDDLGQPRRLGIIRTNNEDRDGELRYGQLVKQHVEACGGEFLVDATFGAGNTDVGAASANVAALNDRAVTTVIFPNAYDTAHSRAAAQIGYLPEWVVLGDYVSERPLQSRLQDQTAWAHARFVTNYPAVLDPQAQPCVQAFEEADPQEPSFEVRNYGCDCYPSLLQLFTGIQVAGPRLNVDNLDRGFHAIPAIRSDDPSVPACYYDVGDYTCVKDGQAQWWDPSGQTPGSSQPGCVRMMEGGRRYLAGQWPDGDVEAQRGDTASDPCNAQGPDVA